MSNAFISIHNVSSVRVNDIRDYDEPGPGVFHTRKIIADTENGSTFEVVLFSHDRSALTLPELVLEEEKPADSRIDVLVSALMRIARAGFPDDVRELREVAAEALAEYGIPAAEAA